MPSARHLLFPPGLCAIMSRLVFQPFPMNRKSSYLCILQDMRLLQKLAQQITQENTGQRLLRKSSSTYHRENFLADFSSSRPRIPSNSAPILPSRPFHSYLATDL